MSPTADDECKRHHCPRSQCPDDTTHTKSLGASDTLWTVADTVARTQGITRNEFITEALGTWLATPDDRTDATPEHSLGLVKCHTVRLLVPQQAELEAKAARLSASDSSCINAAMLQAVLQTVPELPKTADRTRAWKRPNKKRQVPYTAEFRSKAVAMVEQEHRAVPSVAGELGVKADTIHWWLSLHRNKHAPAPVAEAAATAPRTPKPAPKTEKPATARTEPPAPVPAPRVEKAAVVAELQGRIRQMETAPAVAAGTAIFQEPGAQRVVTMPVPEGRVPAVMCPPHPKRRVIKGFCGACGRPAGDNEKIK